MQLLTVFWLDVYLCQDVNEAVTLFTDRITHILDTMAPVKTFQMRSNYAPWLSQETKQLMRERDIAQHRASSSKLNCDWNYYKNLRNQVNRLLKRKKLSGKPRSCKVCLRILVWYGKI